MQHAIPFGCVWDNISNEINAVQMHIGWIWKEPFVLHLHLHSHLYTNSLSNLCCMFCFRFSILAIRQIKTVLHHENNMRFFLHEKHSHPFYSLWFFLKHTVSDEMVWYFMLISTKQIEKQTQICHFHFKKIRDIFHTIMIHLHGKFPIRNGR